MDPDADHIRGPEVDDLVRRALTQPPHVAARVVAAARGAGAGTPGRVARLPRGAWAVTVLLLLACAALGGSWWWRVAAPAPSARGTMTNDGNIIVISMPGAPITLVGPGADTFLAPSGTSSIVLLGEPQ
jgi:hypothetical protein